MTLIVHHLQPSQAERIIWLLEELSVPYELKTYPRLPTGLAPPIFKTLHPAGTSPVFEDTSATLKSPGPSGATHVVLAESGAIVEYIIHKYGGGRLWRTPTQADYADFLEWFHFSNATLQAGNMRAMLMGVAVPAEQQDGMIFQFVQARAQSALAMVEERLKATGKYLAGDELSAADIMTMYSLSTNRGFRPVDLGPYPSVLAYLARVGERPAYRRAIEKGTPGMQPMLGATVERFDFSAVKPS